MSKKWTKSQKKAIDARGMQILVSAAAGSGKTTVLTERVKNILLDPADPCDVSELLVVTFTKAAAAEMRDRIYSALKEAADLKKSSDYLRSQMIKLPTADICTMDSFCSKIVKENFASAGVEVDFKILDDNEVAEFNSDAVNKVIDDLYAEDDPNFKKLTTMFLSDRDDSALAEIIKKLYMYSRSYPSPELWIDNLAESFNVDKKPNDTPWASVIYKYIKLLADYHYKNLSKCYDMIIDDGKFTPEYTAQIDTTRNNYKALYDLAAAKDWDGVVQIIRNGLIAPKLGTKNTKVDAKVKNLCALAFSSAEKDAGKLNGYTFPTIDEHKKDNEILYPIVKKLCESVKTLTKVLDEMKKEANSYCFDDILHKCIDLLVEFDGVDYKRTSLAESLRDKYKEVLIDEYQDTNEAQNIIFEALSKDKTNLYCVGDVKQSIYGFRLASPELFMNLRKTLSDYDGSIKPSQITLETNFRSREGIDKAVNYLFKSIMSEDVGEIDYNDRECLVFNADYAPKNTPDTEFICIPTENMKVAQTVEYEAKTVADYIERVVESGVTIKTKEGERAVDYSDFCILLRSVKGRSDVYVDALKKKGIPSTTIVDGDISEMKEIELIISFIKVINNPLMDIPLISVLMSPVFGFTADELAEIRIINRNSELFPCLQKYSEKSTKAARFLEKFKLYKNISVSRPINELVKFIVDDTGICDIYSSQKSGLQRVNNIKGFIKLSDDFIKNGRNGLNSFVRFIDNAIANKNIKTYAGNGEATGVQIMSIHKSKGLEFPYVIISDLSKQFNQMDLKEALTLNKKTGVGLKIRDDENFTTYKTISASATEQAILLSDASEELRVLYVAMTRAKEHLTFVTSVSGKSLRERITLNNALAKDKDGKIHPYAVLKASSLSEWILTVFVNHPDCEILRDVCDYNTFDFSTVDFGVDITFVDPIDDPVTEDEDNKKPEALCDVKLLEEIERRVNYEYPYDYSGVLAKRTASSAELKTANREYFAKAKPKFLGKSFTGADRGTAIHKFLELCDFCKASVSVENEKQRLLESGKMTEKELSVLEPSAVENFFNSSVGQRLLKSNEVLKEYEFTFFKNAGDLYPDLNGEAADEQIVIQGKLDCAFIEDDREAVLIDYKSDNITDENQLKSIYSPQLQIYADALEACTGCKVKEKYLYSFKLKKFIAL